MYVNKPPLTPGAAAILRSQGRKPTTLPMGNMRPGLPKPVQPVQPLDKGKPRAGLVRK